MNLLRTILAGLAFLLAILVTAPLLLVTLVVLAVPWLTRRWGKRLEPRHVPWQQLIESHPVLGWKPRGNMKGYHRADDIYLATTDADGWRGRATIEESQVLVFGDSFAWGFGIDDADFFANLARTVRIKSIGINGYTFG